MSIAASGNRLEGERQAFEVAEEARETTWVHPSFCAELFAGKFNFDHIYPYPVQPADDRKIGDEYVQKILEYLKNNLDAEKVDRTGNIPDEVIRGLVDMKAFAMKIPKEYGGLAFSQTNYNRVIGAVSSYCASTAVWLSAHQSIGVPQPLKMFGTAEQKKKWLPRLASGAISAFALTEEGVGSDPAKMTTTAVPSEDGKHWILNGEKLWCTNGVVADLLIVMAATPSKKMPDGREKKQISAFVVEKGTPGFSIKHRCDFMGLRGIQNGVLKFENVKIPRDNLLWEEGKGLKLALITLNTGRLTLPAACAAAGKVCLQISRNWASDRKQWGTRIGEHEAPAARLLLAAGGTYAIEAVSNLTAGMADRGASDIRIEASIAKLFATGLGWRIVDNTLQLRGGRGFETAESLRARGEDAYPIERAMRDYRINMIIEGTSDIQRLFCAREALDMHLSLASNIFDPKSSLVAKLGTLIKMTAFYAHWYPRQWIHFSFFPRFLWAGGWESGMLRFIKASAHKMARTTFHAMLRHGPALEKKQLLLGRIVDAGMHLFVMSAVMSLYLTKKKEGRLEKNENLLVQAVCDYLKSGAVASLRQARPFASHRSVVQLSKAAMQGDFKWLEEGIFSVETAARPERKTSVPNSNGYRADLTSNFH